MSNDKANKGTPKSLEQAISNGLEEYGFVNNSKLTGYVLKHVRDFISQKAIAKDLATDQTIKKFFYKIFNEIPKLIVLGLIGLSIGCGAQGLNITVNSSTGACSGSAVGNWDNVAHNNTLALTASCAGTTTYCNEAFTYQPINSTTFTLTVSQTNGGPECLPIGQTMCTASFITSSVLAVNCGGGKNLTTNYNRL